MQSWQIKALTLEVSALNGLDDFIHAHALFFLIGVIYLLLALLAWVLSVILKPRGIKSTRSVRPAVIIQWVETPPPPAEEPFNPFPPYREPSHYDCDDHYPD